MTIPEYKLKIEKYTDVTHLRKMCDMTHRGKSNKITLDNMYRCEHSPIRTQRFHIELFDFPTFVSVHMVRHHVGIDHYVLTNREDYGGPEDPTKIHRLSPVNHGMDVNAEALINIAKKRLCKKAHRVAQDFVQKIKKELAGGVDPDLDPYLVPMCVYRNWLCPEMKNGRGCGQLGQQMKEYGYYYNLIMTKGYYIE